MKMSCGSRDAWSRKKSPIPYVTWSQRVYGIGTKFCSVWQVRGESPRQEGSYCSRCAWDNQGTVPEGPYVDYPFWCIPNTAIKNTVVIKGTLSKKQFFIQRKPGNRHYFICFHFWDTVSLCRVSSYPWTCYVARLASDSWQWFLPQASECWNYRHTLPQTLLFKEW